MRHVRSSGWLYILDPILWGIICLLLYGMMFWAIAAPDGVAFLISRLILWDWS